MDVEARATYRIEAFGGLSVAGGLAPLTGAATQRKTLLLLAVLAASGAQGIGRERLLGLFWPDSDTDRARNALKQALHILRRDLRDPELIIGTAVVRLNPESITSDVAEFEEALAIGELERAAALYRGPFLDGLWLDGAPEFERWLERERARLAHAYAAALEKLATAAAASGDHRRAVEWWRRRAASDPLSSRVAVALMKALVRADEPEAALQHARVHETLVRQELETPPDPVVAAYVEEVRAQLREPAPVPTRLRQAPATAATAATAPTIGAAEAAAPPAAIETSVENTPPPSPPASSAAGRPTGLRRVTGAIVVSHRRLAVALASVVGVAIVLAIILAGTLAARRESDRPAASVATPRSVAVLPFVSMSADPSDAYFSDGLSEALITALSRAQGLDVAARTSSFALRGANLDVRTIGDTLGVAAVVEGSVRKDGGRLRITAQLIDARTGYHLWASEYDREMTDVFAVQDEIAGAIARALQLTLGDGGRRTARPTDPEAYDRYLRGIWFRNRLSKESLFKSIEHFDRAIALDSTWALAYAGKASAMAPLFYFRHVPREPGLTEMRAATRRALELDESLGEAHVAMGVLHFFYDWNWPEAEREFRRATELNPGDAHAFHHLGNYLSATGHFDAAIAARRRAVELDPLNPRSLITLANIYLTTRQYGPATEYFQRAVDIDSMNPLLLGTGPSLPTGIGEVYEEQGHFAAAVTEYVRVAARRGATAVQLRALRDGFAADGMPGFWRAWLDFEEQTTAGQPRALRVAAIHARTGDTARTVEWLERAYRERDPGFVFVGRNLVWEQARGDPRVVAMLAAMRRGRSAAGVPPR